MKLVIAGTGYVEALRIARVMSAGANSESFSVVGFLDDNPENASRDLLGEQIVGGFRDVKKFADAKVINCVYRTCQLRRMTTEVLMKEEAKFTNIIHPSVDLSGVKIGTGNIVGRGVVLEPGVTIGDHNVILHNTVIAHDTSIGSYSFIGHQCALQGFNSIGDECYLGSGTITVPEVVIGSKVKTGINSSIASNLVVGCTVIASPSRVIS